MPDLILPLDIDLPPYEPTSTWSMDHKAYPYREYSINVRYVTDKGELQLPIAAPYTNLSRPPAVSIGIHAPISKKIVEFSIAREGHKPLIPSPTPPDSNHVLELDEILSDSVQLMEDGTTFLFRVVGRYVYSLKVPVHVGLDDLTTSSPPVTIVELENTKIKGGSFVSGLI